MANDASLADLISFYAVTGDPPFTVFLHHGGDYAHLVLHLASLSAKLLAYGTTTILVKKDERGVGKALCAVVVWCPAGRKDIPVPELSKGRIL